MKIKIKGPYHFDFVLDRLSLDPLNVIDKEKKSVKVPIMIDKKPVAAKVTSIGSIENPTFLIEGVGKEGLDRLTEIFQWNVSLTEIQEHFQKTNLKDLFDCHYGTPFVLDFDPYSCLLKCIIHQQLNLSFAYTLTERFVKTFGFKHDGVWFYPTPETVASLTEEDLRKLQFSGRKAEYVIGIANEIVKGTLDFSSFHEKSDAEIMDILIKIRGIGPWTVQNFLMFGLARQNLFPLADIGLQNAWKKYFHLEHKPSKKQMEQWTKEWEPYLSYASLYLWRSIE